MSQGQTETQQTTTVPAQQPEKEQPKRSTGYRLQEQKTFEINRSHTNRRQKAQVMKFITIGLFGRRRYRNMYLVCSLNNFYPALMIANTLQKRVQKLALVISMDKVKFTQFAEQGAQGAEKQSSIFTIKITREPTEEDKQHPGFNGGLQNIQNPLTEILGTRRIGDKRKGGNRRNQPRREGERRQTRDNRRRDDRNTSETRRNQRRNDQKPKNTGRRIKQGQSRNTRGRYENRENRENRYAGNTRDRNYQDRRQQRDTRNNDRDNRRSNQWENREEEDFDRRPRRQQYRQNKQERIEDDSYRRGETRTRGGPRKNQGGRVADHAYKKEHMNRADNERQERGGRAPRNSNRYSSDEEK